MERRLKSGLVTARTGVKPVSLQHTVVERGVRISIVGVDLMKGPVRRCAVFLISISFEYRPVLSVAESNLFTAAQPNRRGLHVRRRKRRVALMRHAARARRVRQ